MAAVVVLLVAVAGGVTWLVRASGEGGPVANPTTAYTYAANPAIAAMNSAAAERDAAKDKVKTTIGDAMSAQSAALLAGDRAAFTGLADADAKLVAPWLSERFTSLRAMGIAQWSTTVASITEWGTQRWQANVDVDYCFVAPCGRPLRQSLHTMWYLGDPTGPKLTEIYPGRSGRTSPPWTQSVLQARSGSRVIVASTAANAGRLAGALAEAEAAAQVADRFAGTARPGKYVIYLAGKTEWGKWPYGDEGNWVAGYAQEETESVVVKLSALHLIPMKALLRHELTHVASLAGQSDEVKRADSWWLTEGLAEYAISGGSPYSAYPRKAETSAFVKTKWSGDLRVGEPASKTSARDASARYGTAYLGVGCLFQTYGPEKALAFVHEVAVEADSLTTAATRALGTSWSAVGSTCAARIRSTAK
ncbi:hypothetical protein [Actinoplanes sp. NPDC026619]|uniref:hypothetical protein n=1 Tax=Actinoplanes sp. NPDC026619 TaxID=3155798 RepID=UPI0033D268BD